MASKQVPKKIKMSYLSILDTYGEEGLFQRCVGAGMLHSATVGDVDIEMLDLAESFLALYRRTGEEKFALISKIQKRAAHVVYRQLLRIHKDKKPNYKRFLNLVA